MMRAEEALPAPTPTILRAPTLPGYYNGEWGMGSAGRGPGGAAVKAPGGGIKLNS